jgi:hypothetical protein
LNDCFNIFPKKFSVKMDISQEWICDTCGLPIKESSDGRIEWLEWNDNGCTGKGLRLVHHISASPRKDVVQYGCYTYATTYAQGLNDQELSEFLGDDGLMLLLSKLTNRELPVDEVVEMIKRLHISGYEQARLHFNKAVLEGAFEPSADQGYYSQQDIESVLEFVRNRE